MLPAGTSSIFDWGDDYFIKEYRNAAVYGDRDGEDLLHEGEVRVLANGWVELPTGRLISPDAVHHVDPQPMQSEE